RIRVARPAVTVAAAPMTPAAAAPAAAGAAAAPAAGGNDLGKHPGAVKSPMVGTAYLSPEPDKPHFVAVGDKVTAGQTLLI
ncbi:acetyl-CoA carboxylase biotin carboxyl carrier protein, partial [Vibrio parahaemolyticus]